MMESENVINQYSEKRLYPELFSSNLEHGRLGLNEDWFCDEFVNLILTVKENNANCDVNSLVRTGIIREEASQIYSLPIFKAEICKKILEEKDNYLRSGLPITRPNSMNRYGLILNTIGMRDILTEFMSGYLWPVTKLLFQDLVEPFDDHHSFIVSYRPNEDTELDMHTDDSDITWNICLSPAPTFSGSTLNFCGDVGNSDHRKFVRTYQHDLGRGVVHFGSRRHGASPLVDGERHNLIIWCRSSLIRKDSSERNYRKEEGPPDIVCLSWTHDRDYGVYKDYPPNKNPYFYVDRNITARAQPWCPPPEYEYDGMESIKERMISRILTEETGDDCY